MLNGEQNTHCGLVPYDITLLGTEQRCIERRFGACVTTSARDPGPKDRWSVQAIGVDGLGCHKLSSVNARACSTRARSTGRASKEVALDATAQPQSPKSSFRKPGDRS
jgi:hypothetical protein